MERDNFEVVLVEDNPTDVFVIRNILGQSCSDVTLRVLTDGQEALRYFENLAGDESSRPPSIVLLDLNIPKVSGFDVLRKIRSISRWDRIPVVIVTSSNSREDHVTAQQLSADAFFNKPADLRAYFELGGLVQQILGSR